MTWRGKAAERVAKEARKDVARWVSQHGEQRRLAVVKRGDSGKEGCGSVEGRL